MNTVNVNRSTQSVQPSRLSWEEPAVAFERPLMAEAQGGPGPHGAPSGLLGPLASSGQVPPAGCD